MSAKVIWKYSLLAAQGQFVSMPKGAEIIRVGQQNSNPFIWVLVDPTANYEDRKIFLFGTGEVIPDIEQKEYRGSFELLDALGEGQPFIGHIFEPKGK